MSETEPAAPPVQVAFQGTQGAFAEAAARRALGDRIRPVPCRTFLEVARAVRSGAARYGVLPIENLIAGPVRAARDALEVGGLVTVAEVELPIEQCLLVVPGAPLTGLRRVISHPVALAQCGRFLATHPAWVAAPYWDTAGAARHVARRGRPSLAAIAGREAASRYGLEIAAAGIGDRPDNVTRFIVIANRLGVSPG